MGLSGDYPSATRNIRCSLCEDYCPQEPKAIRLTCEFSGAGAEPGGRCRVRCSDSPGFEPVLRERLTGTRPLAVVGIGDELSPHGRLGMLAARRIGALGLPDLKVFYGGTMPESVTAPVWRSKPAHILFIDAAVMGKKPGTLGLIEACEVHADVLITHALPLPVVMEYLEKEAKAPVTLMGIQPDLTASGEKPTREEEAGIERLASILARVHSGITS